MTSKLFALLLQPESIQNATQDICICSRQHLPGDAHLNVAAAEALAAVQAPDEAAAVELSALQAHSQLLEQQVPQAALPVKARKLVPQQPQLTADESLTAATCTKSAQRPSTGGNSPAEDTGDSLAADSAEMHQPAAGSVAPKEQREKELLSGELMPESDCLLKHEHPSLLLLAVCTSSEATEHASDDLCVETSEGNPAMLPSPYLFSTKLSTPWAAGYCKPSLAGTSQGFLMHALRALDCTEQHVSLH